MKDKLVNPRTEPAIEIQRLGKIIIEVNQILIKELFQTKLH